MIQAFTLIKKIFIMTLFFIGLLYPQQNINTSLKSSSSVTKQEKSNLDDSRNRFPEILHDVKILLSEVLIADYHQDTLEVIFNLSRIYDLLMEADQIGDMNLEDQEEFERFEKSFLDVYTHKLVTIKSSDAPVTAERFRRDITEVLELLKSKMGDTKFTVVDDRDGHIPLVRNKQVDQFITIYFTTAKGRKQFSIWMKRYEEYKGLILSILRQHEMPEELMILAMIESGLNQKHIVEQMPQEWQFIYSTGKNYGLKKEIGMLMKDEIQLRQHTRHANI